MPIYQLTGKDGRIYRIEGPAGLQKEAVQAAILKKAPQAAVPPQEKSAIEEIPLIGGILSPIADIPLSAVEGLAGVSKSFTDLFGADNVASDFAEDVSRMARDLRSAGSREDEAIARQIQKEAEGKGVWEEVKAAARAFTYSPLESTASAAGSAIPFIAAGLAAPATGGSSLVPVATMAGLGAASGVGTIKGAIYDSVYEEFKRAGASDEAAIAAAERAQEYGGKNMDQMALGGALGALASATGFSRQIATTIGKNAAAKAAARVAAREAAGEGVEVGARRGLISGTARGIAEEAVPEAIQGGQEKLAANIAAQREGFDVDTWKGVAGQAVTEGLASILLGGYGGARETRQENRDLLVKEIQKEFDALPPTADEKQLGDAVERFTRRGFPPEIAQRVVKRMADEKVAIEERAAAMAKAREEAVAARTAGVSPPADVDISAPPPVDQEEQAAMQQMREAEAMGIEPEPTAAPTFTPKSYVDRYFAGEGRGNTQADLEMQQYAANNAAEIEAEFMRRQAQQKPSGKQPSTVTPARAVSILNDPVQFSDFQATTGMDEPEAISTLSAIAEGEGVELKYSRRGRPPSASTLEEAGQDSLFGALPTEQKERLSKREEVAQYQLGQRGKSPEEIEQERQQRADEYMALQERAKERDAQFTSEFVDRIATAVREAHPANAAYSVEVVPESPKPYRIVGPDNELFVASDNLQDFEEQAMELTPYTPPPLSAQQVEDDTTQPTVATSMVQGLTKEIDAALMRGEIDNNQRAELLAPLYRPSAYDKFNRPMDNIAKAEAEARAAMSKFRNATGVEAKAAEAELVVANEKLAKLVNNRLLNPVRSKLRSMTENRQLEREGATLRKETARVQKRLGEMEGADTAPEQREMREAAIDIEETKPSKYRKPDAKPQTKTNLKEVEQVVEQATRGWKGPADVVVVQSVNDITDPAIRNAIKRDNASDAEGFVTPDGTVYLIADNLESVERARAVLFHEGLGHIGLARLFREELDAALLAMYKGNGTLRAQADEWLRQNPDAYRGDNQTVRAIEEVLAEQSEAGYIKPGFFKRLAAIVRNFARRLGMKIALSDADVEVILATAHEQVIKGGKPTGTGGIRYIVGWHGSPYDFTSFSTEFINSGEGAQVYGWGLYFSSNEKVARWYRDSLGGNSIIITVNGKERSARDYNAATLVEYLDLREGDFSPRYPAQYMLQLFAGVYPGKSQTLEDVIADMREQYDHYPKQSVEEAVAAVRAVKPRFVAGGKLYNVKLAPTQEEMLDWDLAFIWQPEKVRNALQKLGFDINDLGALDGNELYKKLSKKLGSDKAASLALLDAGVRGITYVGNESSQRNYVVFADEDVDVRAKFSKPKTTKKTAEALQETEADMSVGLRRMEKTRSTYDAAEGLSESIKGRKMEPFLDAFKENYSGMKPAALVATLRVMPTSGILNWFSTDIPRLKEVDDLMQRMVAMKANILKAADPIAVALQEFLARDEDKLLARSMGINRINEMSPDEHKSAADALANHPAMKELKKRILQNSNDKKLAQQTIDDVIKAVMEYKSALPKNGDITKMPQAFQRLITQLDKTAIDVKATAVQQKQLVELVRRIRDTYAAWDALGELEGGQELYKQVRSFYKDMFEAELALLDARIDKLGDAKEAKRLRDLRADMMREVLNPEEARKAGDIFWNMDADLFSKDYFPFMREGLYWLRVKASKGREREREFYTFQTAKEMQRAQKAVAARLKVDPEDPEVIEVGYDISTLQQALKSEDQIMQKVFDIVAKAKEQFQSSGVLGPKDFSDLTDSIYQTWLMTTPERSVRRRFMHADEVVGQQLDVLQQFSTQATNYANQLSKMAFAGDVRLALSAAEDSVVDRPATEKAKLKAVINEFSERAESEINPDPQSALVNLLNRASYFYYLTSASTALLQMTSIPIRVVPRLWRDYGFAKGTAMWVKYMKLWKSLGRAKTEKISTGIGDQLHAMMPNVMGSKLLNDGSERSKLLKRAMDVGMERNILETVQDTLVQNEREVAQRTKTGAARVASNVAAETGKIMGVMFQGMENITRQSAYFMAFELAYDDIKAKKPKASEDEVFNEAVNRALDTVRDTLGDYSNWERSRLMKKDWTRAVFLFKMHPIVQTKFMVGAFRDIIRGFYPGSTPEMKAARAGAMKELMGVTMMAGMFGGLMAMPLYTPLAWALAEGFDDEDDEDVRKLMGMDPRVAYDSDIMFRAWMMEKFGTPKLGNVPLADLLVHGPLAALTDTELASRVSMDLKSMWFREAVAGDSTADVMVKTALANIAPGQMLIQMLNAKDNFADGDIYGGLRKLTPAFFRSWIAGTQGEIEGIETRKGDMIIPKEDITAFDTARTLLGFRPMTLARWQDYYITRSKNDKKIEGEKSKLLAKLDRKIREGEITTVQELREFWKDEILPFNRSYPDEALIITPDSIERSLKGREEVRSRTVKGMQLDKKTAVKDYEAAKPFMP